MDSIVLEGLRVSCALPIVVTILHSEVFHCDNFKMFFFLTRGMTSFTPQWSIMSCHIVSLWLQKGWIGPGNELLGFKERPFPIYLLRETNVAIRASWLYSAPHPYPLPGYDCIAAGGNWQDQGMGVEPLSLHSCAPILILFFQQQSWLYALYLYVNPLYTFWHFDLKWALQWDCLTDSYNEASTRDYCSAVVNKSSLHLAFDS